MPQNDDPAAALDRWIDALDADDETREVMAPSDLLTVEIGGRLPRRDGSALRVAC